MNTASGTEPYYLGIDLGGSRIKSVAVNGVGQTLEQESIPFEDREMEWAKRIQEMVLDLRLRRGWPVGIGLSAPGLAARDARSIMHMPGRLRGLEGLDWQQHLGFAKPIFVLNDAHSALLGEVWIGAAQGLENVFMLTLGTGVGGAAIVDGRLLRGHLGRAGHLGHISLDSSAKNDDVGTPGSLEAAIGNKTLMERSQGRYTSTEALVRDARLGDPQANVLWHDSVRCLAIGINSLINVLDPEAVILGGGISQAGPDLFELLTGFLHRHEWCPTGLGVRIMPATLGDLAGAYGAARHAILCHQGIAAT